MAYTTIDDPTIYFNTKLYTGNSTTDTGITGVGFQPDWLWVKSRGAAESHFLNDSVRGAGKNIKSESSGAEGTETQDIKSFDSDGFTLGSNDGVNDSGFNYVSWNWKAGTSVSGNTGGSGTAKTYSGSVNTTAGFSIINFVGNGTAGHTIPHHLGVAPKMVIVKNRTSGSTNWQTYHYGLDDGAGTNEIFLDLTNVKNASSGAWNNTAPTSTVVTKGTGSYGNENDSNHIMYSFAEKKGFSKFGSYTGNGNADGPFVYTGFKPAWVMFKPAGESADWTIVDNKRNTFNVVKDKTLNANLSSAEHDGSMDTDFLSNGFKIRNANTDNNSSNAAGIIYMAFAESPFVTGASAIPTTAR